MALLSKKKTVCSPACTFMKWLIAVVLTVAVIAALVGVYETHVIVSEEPVRVALQFGATSGSLAILAFVVTLLAWMKHLKCMMGSCEVCSR